MLGSDFGSFQVLASGLIGSVAGVRLPVTGILRISIQANCLLQFLDERLRARGDRPLTLSPLEAFLALR
jgi:hypothetical protein